MIKQNKIFRYDEEYAKSLENKIAVIGSGAGKIYPNLPDEIKDMITLVDANEINSKNSNDLMSGLLNGSLNEDLNNIKANAEYNLAKEKAYNPGKQRKQSNKKYHKRKKAINGKQKRRK